MTRTIPAVIGAALLLAGCETTQRTAALDQALLAYDTHRYSSAHSRAVEAMRTTNPREREKAAYIAGLSAYQLGDVDEAERRLVQAVDSTDTQIAGSAKAVLGQVRLDQGRPAEAARLFEEAASALSGADAAEAAKYAAMAHEQAGNRGAAARWAGGGGNASGFALQVGAFHDLLRAREAARTAEEIAQRDGLGPVSIVTSRDARGRELYLVHIGRFDTRMAAAQARSSVGRLEYIVAPVATP